LNTADEPKIEPGKDIPDGYSIDIVVADVMKSPVDCVGGIGGVNPIRKVLARDDDGSLRNRNACHRASHNQIPSCVDHSREVKGLTWIE
jgi:hypothetical protein